MLYLSSQPCSPIAILLVFIPSMEYYKRMAWSVEHTDEFAEWYVSLSESQQDDLTAVGLLLMEQGPQLPFPYSSGISGSRHAHSARTPCAKRRASDSGILRLRS